MSSEKTTFVLDSFALLAYLGGEQGVKRVKAVLREAQGGNLRVCMSLVNLGELMYITERKQGLLRAQAVLAVIDSLPLELLPANRRAVLDAAHIKARHPMAYADAFAVAAAQVLDGVILTGDPEFRLVETIVQVEWL